MEPITSVPPVLADFIKIVAEEQQLNDYIIADVKTNRKGEGYMGEIFMVSVKEKNSNRQLDMVIKAAFTDAKTRQLAPIESAFKNEIYFYQNVHPMFKRLERIHNITEFTEIIPRCLKVNTKENQEMLALENLQTLGFEVFDKKQLLDHDHIELIFKTYGRFHAYSYAFRDQNLAEYTKLVEKFINIYEEFFKSGMYGSYWADMVKLGQASLIPGEDDRIIEQFRKYEGPNVGNILRQAVVENCEYSAILHGDCWSNNLLFRYKEEGNRRIPIDIRIIDLQILKTGSPVCDLSYCLYTGASKEIFDHLSDYLNIYYKSFSSFLRRLGHDPEKLFPFTALENHWKMYSKFGMIVALSMVKTKLTDADNVVDLKDGTDSEQVLSAILKTKFNEEEYRKRIRGLLRHMYAIGAL